MAEGGHQHDCATVLHDSSRPCDCGYRDAIEAKGCDPQTCLCCVCCLRREPEFAEAFTPGDKCCDGCHREMAADGWPGHRCSTLCRHCARRITYHPERLRGLRWRDDSPHSPATCFAASNLVHEPVEDRP